MENKLEMELHKIQSLLEQVGIKRKHGEEIAREKGENFNIFKILNLETRENQTHSAFLREMLDPKGSHEMGAVFLNHFLSQIKTKLHDQSQKIKILDQINSNSSKCKVRTEHSIGPTNLIEKTGGRLDVAVKDIRGLNIIIENKIYAADQEAQIERYFKHETERSIVFYLTLEGVEPITNSKGSLKSGKDFFLLSYKTDIICWLELCLKESADRPILRETIKQYIILIKKLTNQLTNQKMEGEIKELMIKNLHESRKVYDLYLPVLADIRNKFRDAVAKKIIDATDCELSFMDISKDNADMIINSKSNLVHIAASPFSISSYFSNLHVGIWIGMSKVKSEILNEFIISHKINFNANEWWLNREELGISLADLSELQKLSNEKHFSDRVENVSNKIIEYYRNNLYLVKELEILFPST